MQTAQPPITTACVFGSSGGIGNAIIRQLAVEPDCTIVHSGSRTGAIPTGKIAPFRFDLTDEASIANAAAQIGRSGSLDFIFVATGMLHDGPITPEKSYRAQTIDAYAQAFAINCTGPALIGKHFLPLLPRDRRSVFAVLSARVGSISDNRLGGWHAYRASKAALNMVVRNFAVELARTHPHAIVAALHPGTVDTALSEPFQANVAEGKLFTPDYAAERLLTVLDNLTPTDSGHLYAWDGERIPF